MVSPLAAPGVQRANAVVDYGVDVLGGMESGGSYDIDLANMFFDEEPEDLYALIYKKVKYDPAAITIKRSMNDRTLTPEERDALFRNQGVYNSRLAGGALAGSDVPVDYLSAGEGGGSSLTFNTAGQRAGKLERTLALEQEISELEAEIEAEVKPSEIFANGILEDSGFDLLTDLDIIQSILFAVEIPIYGNTGPSNPAGANRVGFDGADGNEDDDNGAGEGSNAGVGNDDNGAGRGPAGRGQDRAALAGDQDLNQAVASQGAVCYADTDFNSAARALGLDEIARDMTAAQSISQGLTSADDGGGAQPNDGADGNSGDENDDSSASGPEKPIASSPADWASDPFCGDSFCLTVEARTKTRSTYLANQNCIACHIEKINDTFDKLTKNNLSPNKITGNLLEVPKCTRGISLGGFLNMNVIVVSQPIITPPDDDLVIESDFLQEFSDMWDSAYPDRKSVGGSGKDRNVEEEAALRAAGQSSESTKATDSVRKIREEVASRRTQALDNMARLRNEVLAKNMKTSFSVLKVEMDTMNAYFKSFQSIFANMKAPCDALNNKQVCE